MSLSHLSPWHHSPVNMYIQLHSQVSLVCISLQIIYLIILNFTFPVLCENKSLNHGKWIWSISSHELQSILDFTLFKKYFWISCSQFSIPKLYFFRQTHISSPSIPKHSPEQSENKISDKYEVICDKSYLNLKT